MADNDPAALQPEVDPGIIRSDESQEVTAGTETMETGDNPRGEHLVNSSGAEEPKAGANASEHVSVPDGEAQGGTVATLPDQATSPRPPGDDVPNTAEENPPPSESIPETVSNAALAIAAPISAKRFTSMNINKKFLAKTAASPGSSSSTAAPKAPASTSATRLVMPNPATPSRLVTKKLTTATSAPPVSGGWSLRATPPASLSSSPAPGDAPAAQLYPSAKPSGPADALKRPALASSTSALSTNSRPSAVTSRDQSPVKAWASVPVPTGDLGRNLQDFPTAAEAAADHSEGKRPGTSTIREPHDTDAPPHTDEGDTRDSFRGIHLDPKAHHWDEMEDESNDFLGEVIDFGDGKTYTVPPEEEENVATTVSKETRFGDDYDRSWPRTRPSASDADGAHAGHLASQHSRFPPTHGLPPRHPPGDGRVLFNERSNRLEPARVPTSTHVLAPSGSSHFHGPPHTHVPRGTGRRNSALSASEHPKMGALRDLPPHARDPPPHAVPGAALENRGRRPSDARSTHSPVERRSSFLHDEERPRIGSIAPRSRVGDESGSAFHALKRETSRDSRISTGERQPRGVALQRTTSQRTATDSSHALEPATVPSIPHSDQVASSVSSDNVARRSLLSPSHQVGTLPTIPSPQVPLATMPTGTSEPTENSLPPIAPAVLNDEREKFMKQAAERARRRKLEEEAMREEARERARKKAAELEALSKASLVSASPLVALTRKSSAAGLSSGAKSPVPKSPSVSPAALLTSPVASGGPPDKPKEIPDSSSAAATLSSWRAKPEPEPPVTSVPPEAPKLSIAPQPDSVQRPPPTVELGPSEGMGLIEELGQADGPVEVLDFSDMSKLAGRRTSITSTSDLAKTKRSISDDFLDEIPSGRRPNQVQPPFMHWNRDSRYERPLGDQSEDRARVPSTLFGKHPSGPSRSSQDGAGAKLPLSAAPNQLTLPSRSSFKEAPISALDDVMSRIKGVLTGMHADNEKPMASTSQHPAPSLSSPAPASTSVTAQAPTRSNIGATPRWKGDGVANWRDSSNKRPLNAPLPEAQPTEPFATTCPERSDTPPPAWKTYIVHLNKSSVVRPAMPKKQAALAKLPPMPVRWDILTWDPPVERMSTRTLSRDDTFFPRITIRGVLSARVLLPSTGSSAETQSKQNESPMQRTRLTLVAGPDPKPTRSSNLPTRAPPKGPAFSETQWRKPQVTSPLRNTLELHNHISPAPAVAAAVTATEENQLETTSRSPPPHYIALSQVADSNLASSTTSGSSRTVPKQSWGTDVAFHRSLHEKRPSMIPSVSFTVSSELDDLLIPGPEEGAVAPVPDAGATLEDEASSMVEGETVEAGLPEKINGEKRDQVATGDTSADKITQSPTPNSSVLLTPPVKATPPWQSSNPRLPDADFIKSVWQHASPRDGVATENSLRGLVDDFPSSIPHSVQEMKADEEAKPSRESAATLPTRVPHNAHRAFQHVPTSPIPMHMSGYPSANHLPHGQAGPSRPMPVTSFSLPPPAPPQVTAQPSPYAPYVHPTPPTLMYTMPPSRIAPSPAPGGPPMWMQNPGYGRPSPPAGMYPPQPGPNMSYAPVSQLPPSMSKPHVAINGNHHPMSNPAMSHPMHMTSPAMAHVGHMGSPALAHASPLMPGGPQHGYPGMNSPGGMGMGGNVPYGAQRPAPTMMQQPPMPAPLPNGYGMSPGGSFGPNGYGRANVRSPAVDGMPHHMAVPHPQHAPMSPGAYHPAPNGYVRPW